MGLASAVVSRSTARPYGTAATLKPDGRRGERMFWTMGLAVLDRHPLALDIAGFFRASGSATAGCTNVASRFVVPLYGRLRQVSRSYQSILDCHSGRAIRAFARIERAGI
jgi:hypothetical protein